MFIHYILIPLNLVLIGLYMRARMRDDKGKVRIYQPGAVIVSWVIAASSLLRPDADIPLAAVVLGCPSPSRAQSPPSSERVFRRWHPPSSGWEH